MTVRVSMSTIFNGIQGNLQNLAEDLQKLNASISSGRKYQAISDNPLDVGVLLGLAGESGQVSQYQRNLETAQNWLGATESTLQNLNDIVRGAMVLANQMATGTYNAAQRAAAAQQVQGYLEEVMQVGNTRLNGQYILSGYKIETPPFQPGDWAVEDPVMHLKAGSSGSAAATGAYTGTVSRTYVVEIVSGGAAGAATFRVSEDGGRTWSAPATTGAGVAIGADGVAADFSGDWLAGDRFSIPVYRPISYQGDANTQEIGIGRQSRMAVSQVGSVAVGGDGGVNDVFEILARLKSALEANDPNEVGAGLERLRTYQDHLDAILAGLGASLNRVAIKTGVYDSLQATLTKSLSTKGDTDLVDAVNALKTRETAYQAALLAAGKVMGLSLMDYLPSG